MTGTPPFARDSDVATVYAHLHEPAAPLGDDLPAALGVVLGRALAKDPRDRFATCSELVAAAYASLTARPPRRHRRSVVAITVGLGAAALAGALVLADRGGSDGHSPAATTPPAVAAPTLPLHADRIACSIPPAGASSARRRHPAASAS